MVTVDIGPNGDAQAKSAQPPRRRMSDPDGADYGYRRGYREGHGDGNGNSGGGSRPGAAVTAAMVSVAVGALMLALNLFGVVERRIEATVLPMRIDIEERIANLRRDVIAHQAETTRLEEWFRNEVSRLDREKVKDSTRLEMLGDLNRRLDGLDRQNTAFNETVRIWAGMVLKLQERVLEIEGRFHYQANPPEDPGYGLGRMP